MFGDNIILGQNSFNSDSKGRIFIPSSYDPEKGDRVVVCRSSLDDTYVDLYPEVFIDRKITKIDEAILKSSDDKEIKKLEAMKRKLCDSITCVSVVDGQHRISLRGLLGEYNNQKGLYAVGYKEHLRVYKNKEAFLKSSLTDKRDIATKSDLICYKNMVMNGRRFASCFDDGPTWDEVSLKTIYDSMENLEDSIVDKFKEMIDILQAEKKDADHLSLGLNLGIFVDVNSFDENGDYLVDPQVLEDYVCIVFDGAFCSLDGEETYSYDVALSDILDDSDGELLPQELKTVKLLDEDVHCVKFSDFVVGLLERGFTLEDFPSFGDLVNKTLAGESVTGTISFTTEKNKTFKKSDK